MIKHKIFLLTLVLTTIASSVADAATDRQRPIRKGKGKIKGNERSELPKELTIGSIKHGGDGCPTGTLSIAFAPDNLSFSILYDQFYTTVDPTEVREKMRQQEGGPKDPVQENRAVLKSLKCITDIPMAIPANMQLEITRIDFRGFLDLPKRSRGMISSAFNFRGPGGDKDRIHVGFDFKGPLSEEYELSSDAKVGQVIESEASPCGGQVVLRMVTKLDLISGNVHNSALFTLDSTDSTAQAIYYLNWRKCQGSKAR